MKSTATQRQKTGENVRNVDNQAKKHISYQTIDLKTKENKEIVRRKVVIKTF